MQAPTIVREEATLTTQQDRITVHIDAPAGEQCIGGGFDTDIPGVYPISSMGYQETDNGPFVGWEVVFRNDNGNFGLVQAFGVCVPLEV